MNSIMKEVKRVKNFLKQCTVSELKDKLDKKLLELKREPYAKVN